jgi:hypothetical protein
MAIVAAALEVTLLPISIPVSALGPRRMYWPFRPCGIAPSMTQTNFPGKSWRACSRHFSAWSPAAAMIVSWYSSEMVSRRMSSTFG